MIKHNLDDINNNDESNYQQTIIHNQINSTKNSIMASSSSTNQSTSYLTYNIKSLSTKGEDNTPLSSKDNNNDISENDRLKSVSPIMNIYKTLFYNDLFKMFGDAPPSKKEFFCGWGAALVNITITFPINKIIFRQVSCILFLNIIFNLKLGLILFIVFFSFLLNTDELIRSNFCTIIVCIAFWAYPAFYAPFVLTRLLGVPGAAASPPEAKKKKINK